MYLLCQQSTNLYGFSKLTVSCYHTKQIADLDTKLASFLFPNCPFVPQACEKLQEKAVQVVGREQDIPAIKEAVEGAKSKFKSTYGHDAPSITVANEDYLLAASKGADDEGASW